MSDAGIEDAQEAARTARALLAGGPAKGGGDHGFLIAAIRELSKAVDSLADELKELKGGGSTL